MCQGLHPLLLLMALLFSKVRSIYLVLMCPPFWFILQTLLTPPSPAATHLPPRGSQRRGWRATRESPAASVPKKLWFSSPSSRERSVLTPSRTGSRHTQKNWTRAKLNQKLQLCIKQHLWMLTWPMSLQLMHPLLPFPPQTWELL